ncbi:solute carrier family 22 member 8 isoform X1 [Perca fluviatilis]|uniref:solute carrier family 22 member 8 isoform X1 n=1 Tax=Perca fluviatilis TaxID=8168 RepID=UPI001964EBF0|nr:solute carrier family 22 member 8 isoform X1 [Perca fluviatilis]
MNFDQILSAVGGFGKYQKILYIWICLPQILLAFHMMVSIFTGSTPPHHCRDSSISVAGNQSHFLGTLSLNFSLSDSSCFSSDDLLESNRTERVPCSQGWVYSKETFQSTTVTEWDLVCNKAGLNSLGSSIYMFGLLVGSVLFGAMADRYGRRFILLLSIALQTGFGVAVAFAPNFSVYVILRFLVGTTVSGVIINAFVLGTEWTCTKRRMLAGIFTDYAFGLGYMLLAGIAYLIRDWRKLQLAISAPGFLLIFYIWWENSMSICTLNPLCIEYMNTLFVIHILSSALISGNFRCLCPLFLVSLLSLSTVMLSLSPVRVLPQSARWLLANDRMEEAIALLRKAALVNGRVLPPAVQVEKCQILDGGKRSYSAMDLVRTPQMRKRTIILFYIWFVNVLVYYGLSLGVSKLGTNLYLTQFVFGLIEIPARSLVLLVLPFSRRLSQSGFLAVGGLACLLMLAVPADHPNVLTGLAMVGKFGITASFAVIYVYTAEIFPTVLRQTGIGVSCMFARIGGVLAPIINMLHDHSLTTPLVIFGISPLLGAILGLALPETADRPLPDTVEDAENWDMRSPPNKDNPEMSEDTSQSANSKEQQELRRLASQA